MLDEWTRLTRRLDPSLILDDLGIDGDDWQRQVLRSTSERMLVNVHRQGGKSTCVATLGLLTILEPDSLVLVISVSHRQAGELYRKLVSFYRSLGEPVPAVEDRADTLALVNGSRVVSLPCNPDTVRGFSSPCLVIVDEASRVPDAMFTAISPMLAISRGRLVELTTPFGQRGHFWAAWTTADADWERIEFKASRNPRIDPAFLAQQRLILGPRWYAQEFECSFEDTVDQVFDTPSVLAAFETDEPPLILGG